MGLFSKHKGSGHHYTFALHFHALSPWPADSSGSLCVTYERGSHTGSTRAVAPASPPRQGGGSYVWEQQLQLPATLYEVRRLPPPPLYPPRLHTTPHTAALVGSMCVLRLAPTMQQRMTV